MGKAGVEMEEGDPNFPVGLAIKPFFASVAQGSEEEERSQDKDDRWDRDNEADIDQYGIAGRIWEAVGLLSNYLVPPSQQALPSSSRPSPYLEFDPPCDLFDGRQDINLVELGAGTGVVGINVALHARRLQRQRTDGATWTRRRTRIVLTDLDNVCPLLERNARRAGCFAQSNADDVEETKPDLETEVIVQPLPWGSRKHAEQLLAQSPLPLTHILCSDLVYFPHLLAPLLRSLLDLTTTIQPISGQDDTTANTFEPPKVIIGYRVRSLTKEEPFWRAAAAWFDFEPVLCRRCRPSRSGHSLQRDEKAGEEGGATWRRFGTSASDRRPVDESITAQKEGGKDEEEEEQEEELEDAPSFVFVAKRKEETLDWQAPEQDEMLMGGWLEKSHADGSVERTLGKGMDAFELLLFNALQG